MLINRYEIQVSEVASDLFQITLEQPFYEANFVYLLRGSQNILIDSGYIESLGKLSRSLRFLGLSMKKISHLIYTHNHVDHISGGLLLRRYAPHIQTVGHKRLQKDRDFLFFFHSWIHENERLIKLAYREEKERESHCHEFRHKWFSFLSRFEGTGGKIGDRYIHLDLPVEQGSSLALGDRKIDFIETFGHNRWHISPIDHKQKWLFSGDLLLENIPAIYYNLDGDYLEYKKTLKRVLEQCQGYTFFPSHGKTSYQDKKARLMLRTLDHLERQLLHYLREKSHPTGILLLLEKIFRQRFHSALHSLVGIALLESMLRYLMDQGQVDSHLFANGYEEFFRV